MAECFHGGAFWERIGPRFDDLSRRQEIVAADVLDAWFPPAPSVIHALQEASEWVLRTSPPIHAEGLANAIAEARGIPDRRILPGPGSSALIYLALGQWLHVDSKVLLIEPSYGEYEHYCRHVVGCEVAKIVLRPADGFRLDLSEWAQQCAGHDLAVLVNPNNPCGSVVSFGELGQAMLRVPSSCRVLVDEAYIDYLGEPSAEGLLNEFPNLFVIKSLSKCFALSGLRVGYIAGEVEPLRRYAPPWWVGLSAQIAAIAALGEGAYYRRCYLETANLRDELKRDLDIPCFGAANWLLCCVDKGAGELVARAQGEGVFVRDSGLTAPSLADAWIRVAVRSREENLRVATVLRACREVPLTHGTRTPR